MEREGEKMGEEEEGGKVEYNNPRRRIMCNVVTIYLSRRGMKLFRRRAKENWSQWSDEPIVTTCTVVS